MLLVDVHCHLYSKKFKDDLDEVIERARKAGVKRIIASGVNPSTNRKSIEIAEKYKDIVRTSFGFYPIDALANEIKSGEVEFPRDVEKFDIDEELEWAIKNKDKCIAIGEAGMDFNYGREFEKEQRKNFEKVISIVEKIKKPIIVHTRKAELECVEMLESSKIKNIILHCFCGRKHLVKRAADNGWNFSIPPIIVRLQQFQIMADIVNLSQLLTETDAPYLSPFPGKRNESAYVLETIKKIAEIKNMDKEEVANNIFKNFMEIF